MAYQKNNPTSEDGKEKKKASLKDYVEVNVRIERFWDKYPDGRIHTEIVSIKEGLIIMRAYVYKNREDEVPFADGTAYEREGTSFINETSALENCETSAVGRALAMGGFEIKKSIASKNEIEAAEASRDQNKRGANAMQRAEQLNQNTSPYGREMFEKIKNEWRKQAGNLKGFAEWYTVRAEAGYSNQQIYLSFMAQIEKKQKQASGGE